MPSRLDNTEKSKIVRQVVSAQMRWLIMSALIRVCAVYNSSVFIFGSRSVSFYLEVLACLGVLLVVIFKTIICDHYNPVLLNSIKRQKSREQ